MAAERRLTRRRVATVVVVVTGTLGVAAVAFGAIPAGNGTISGCYTKIGGVLRVVDTDKGERCTKYEVPISWNQTGPQGEAGLQGPPGPAGPQGEKGDAGATGSQGEPGPIGPAGSPGPQGDTGPAGSPGQDGSDGQSAFEIWKSADPSRADATEADFLAALKGDNGPQGLPGPAGPQGLRGDPGPAGPQGLPGPAGPQGVPGLGLERAYEAFDVATVSPDNRSFGVAAYCEPGDLVVGGGYSNLPAEARVTASASTGFGVWTKGSGQTIGWAVSGRYDGASTITVVVRAICLDATP